MTSSTHLPTSSSFSLSGSKTTPTPTTTGNWEIWIKLLCSYDVNLGSCLALNLSYSGCCVWSPLSPCKSNECYCDQDCHDVGDCCSDIAELGCHPASYYSVVVSLTSTNKPLVTQGKRAYWIPIHKLIKLLKVVM